MRTHLTEEECKKACLNIKEEGYLCCKPEHCCAVCEGWILEMYEDLECEEKAERARRDFFDEIDD